MAIVTTDQQLIAKYIEAKPRLEGREDARLVGYGVPVWALIGYYEAVEHDEERVARDYDLPLEAVRAALAYYRQNKKAIDRMLAANAAL